VKMLVATYIPLHHVSPVIPTLALVQATRYRPIWLFWGRCRYIGHSWTDSPSRYFQNF